MAQLRRPATAILRDLEQTIGDQVEDLMESLQALDAMESSSATILAEELGDLLLRRSSFSRRCFEGSFDFADVAQKLDKLVRQQPHISAT